MKRRMIVLLALATAALLGAVARADSNCSVGSGPVALGTVGGGVQACLNAYGIGGTATATTGYAAVDGRPTNPEPLDGYIGAGSGGVYACSSGEYNPAGGNNPATNALTGPCAPQPV